MKLAEALEKQTIDVVGATNRSVSPGIVVLFKGDKDNPSYFAIEEGRGYNAQLPLYSSDDLRDIERFLTEGMPSLNPDAWGLQ